MSHASLLCLTIGMEITSLLTFRILRFRPRRLASLVAQFCVTTRKLLRPPIFFPFTPGTCSQTKFKYTVELLHNGHHWGNSRKMAVMRRWGCNMASVFLTENAHCNISIRNSIKMYQLNINHKPGWGETAI